jgi:hypothetical protein
MVEHHIILKGEEIYWGWEGALNERIHVYSGFVGIEIYSTF